jgi:hypothetical protein
MESKTLKEAIKEDLLEEEIILSDERKGRLFENICDALQKKYVKTKEKYKKPEIGIEEIVVEKGFCNSHGHGFGGGHGGGKGHEYFDNEFEGE